MENPPSSRLNSGKEDSTTHEQVLKCANRGRIYSIDNNRNLLLAIDRTQIPYKPHTYFSEGTMQQPRGLRLEEPFCRTRRAPTLALSQAPRHNRQGGCTWETTIELQTKNGKRF